ncbi:DUF1120 domain-containing protein [Lelliottia aquatilis]|uniref:DUF1120 domain-containing protein n=1 Tax=Lelliottia aquatilis TaxID=2080838 RepID=UPI00192CD70E|nr:DUF1120 domain-containing protein [Lelliottia aquatilis]MBL5884001.1 DUF1120 domain-containing protein [Lelliottia aquatilis]
MKNIFKFCAAAALVISTANSAFAADTADLKVQGTLIMGSCTPSLSSGGVVDYGSLPIASLSDTAVNQLGDKDITLTLSCTSPTKVAWTTMDDKSSSVVDTGPKVAEAVTSPANEFGLGETADHVKLGSYGLVANYEKVTVDSAPGHLADSVDNGATWAAEVSDVYNHPDGSRLITFADTLGNPVEITTATDVLTVGASIQDTTTLAITDDTPLDGQATISVKYL